MTERAARMAAAAQAHAKPATALRVLVADDDRDAVLSLIMLLREERHEVRGVHAGRQVMGAILDFDPDVVLLDIALPDMSGWEVARFIRERRGRERPLIIGITGEYRTGADRVLSQILGFDHYLLKPYDPSVLLSLLPSAGPRAA